jgi:predicted TPR repeat methyltransferase
MPPPASAAQALREALADAHAGRPGPAALKARLVLAAEPANAEAHYVLGLSALLAGNAADAIGPLEHATQLRDAEPRYAFGLGMALDQLGRAEESIAAYQRSITMRPSHFETAANLGGVLQRAGRLDEAIAAYEAALRARPQQPQVLNALGLCLLHTRQAQAAQLHFAAAIAADPGFAAAHNHQGVALNRLGRNEEAIAAIREAIRLRPDYPEAWFNLGEQYYEAGLHREALVALDRALALTPHNQAARYLRSAIAGEALDRPPDDYIRASFDRLAADFDVKLVDTLRYRTPEKMAAFLAPWCEALAAPPRTLDLGCGTGLSGIRLRPLASELAGVDLSPAMLDKARARTLYDALHEASLVDFLANTPSARWDLVVAMDVFIYVGKLDDVFREAARGLAPGGLFAFSVERLDADAGYRLEATGRYAHAGAYLDQLAEAAGLVPWRQSETDIREERGKPVPGLLAAYRKP